MNSNSFSVHFSWNTFVSDIKCLPQVTENLTQIGPRRKRCIFTPMTAESSWICLQARCDPEGRASSGPMSISLVPLGSDLLCVLPLSSSWLLLIVAMITSAIPELTSLLQQPEGEYALWETPLKSKEASFPKSLVSTALYLIGPNWVTCPPLSQSKFCNQ